MRASITKSGETPLAPLSRDVVFGPKPPPPQPALEKPQALRPPPVAKNSRMIFRLCGLLS